MANLITLAEYKESEGISSPKEDLRLNSLIPSVSQLVKTYCGNSLVDFYSSNKTETFNITVQWESGPSGNLVAQTPATFTLELKIYNEWEGIRSFISNYY